MVSWGSDRRNFPQRFEGGLSTRVRIWTHNCLTPKLHVWSQLCGMNSSSLSSGDSEFYPQLYLEKKVLLLGKGISGISKQVEVRIKNIFTLILKLYNMGAQTHEMPRLAPQPSSNMLKIWWTWPQTTLTLWGGMWFINLFVFDLKLTSPKVCVPFSWSKDLHLEASTHPKVSFLAEMILERASFTKFFTSCNFCLARCQALDSWSFLKSAVSFWTTADKNNCHLVSCITFGAGTMYQTLGKTICLYHFIYSS